MTVKERQMLRNKISAQNARLRKKHESIFLLKVVDEKDTKMRQLLEAITEVASPQQLDKLQDLVTESWGIKSPQGKRQRKSPRLGSPTPNPKQRAEEFKSLLMDNFATKDEELEQFKQNDTKEVEHDLLDDKQ